MKHQIVSIDDPFAPEPARRVYGLHRLGQPQLVRPLRGQSTELFPDLAFVRGVGAYLAQRGPAPATDWDGALPDWAPGIMAQARASGYDEAQDAEGRGAALRITLALAEWEDTVQRILRHARAVPMAGSASALVGHRGTTAILLYRDVAGARSLTADAIPQLCAIRADDPHLTFEGWVIYSDAAPPADAGALALPPQVEHRAVAALGDALRAEQRERELLIEALERDLPDFQHLDRWHEHATLVGTFRHGLVAAITPTGPGAFGARYEDWARAAYEQHTAGLEGRLYIVSTATTVDVWDDGRPRFLKYMRQEHGWHPAFDPSTRWGDEGTDDEVWS